MGEALHMYPYFIFGAFILCKWEVYRNDVIAVACGLFFIAVIVLEGDITRNGMGFYWASLDLHDILTRYGLACFIGRTMVGVAGTVFLLWLTTFLCAKIPAIGLLGQFGTTTLGVYVMHEWPLAELGRNEILRTHFPGWTMWPISVALFFSLHYLTVMIKGNDVLRFFFFGNEKWLSSMLGKWFGTDEA